MTRQCSKKEPIESDILDEEEVASEQMVQTLEDGINEEPLIEQSSSNVASNVDSSILGIALPVRSPLDDGEMPRDTELKSSRACGLGFLVERIEIRCCPRIDNTKVISNYQQHFML